MNIVNILEAALCIFISTLTSIPAQDENPRFVGDTQVEIRAVQGTTALLPCQVEDLVLYKVVWQSRKMGLLTFEKRTIIKDKRYSVSRKYAVDWNLQILEVDFGDAGDYYCRINTNPTLDKQLTLIVEEPSSSPATITQAPPTEPTLRAPKINKGQSSGDVMVQEGDTLDLECVAIGSPQPAIRWYRRSLHDRYATPEAVGEGPLLQVTNIERNADALYQCYADNGVPPHDVHEIEVIIEFPPETNIPSPRQSQVIGGDTILECRVTGYPTPEITWSKDDVILTHGDRIQEDRYPEGHNTVSLSVLIGALEKSDFGNYTCTSSNSLGTSKEHLLLYERVVTTPEPEPEPETPPHVVTEPPRRKEAAVIRTDLSSTHRTLAKGQPLELTCRATGYPAPTITWLWQGVGDQIGYEEDLDHEGETFVIDSIESDQSGIYQCVAFNGIEPADRRKMVVTVQSAPVIYVKDIASELYSGDVATLTCVVDSLPESKLVWMFQNRVITNNWKYKTTVTSDNTKSDLTLTVDNLEESDNGEYMCLAQNALGQAKQIVSLTVITPTVPVKPEPETSKPEPETPEPETPAPEVEPETPAPESETPEPESETKMPDGKATPEPEVTAEPTAEVAVAEPESTPEMPIPEATTEPEPEPESEEDVEQVTQKSKPTKKPGGRKHKTKGKGKHKNKKGQQEPEYEPEEVDEDDDDYKTETEPEPGDMGHPEDGENGDEEEVEAEPSSGGDGGGAESIHCHWTYISILFLASVIAVRL